MIRLVEQFEPEQAGLRQHAPFVGNAGGQDPIEGADPVGGNQQQAVAEIINIADLAAMHGPTV